MNAALDILERVRAQGCEVTARGDKIHLRAAKPLPDSLLNALRVHKPDVLAVLSKDISRKPAPEPDDWTPEDWRAYFAEREAIAEYDGGMSRRQAELIAWEACINRWLDFNLPEPGPGGTCAWCKTKAITEAEKLPICNSRSAGWPWVHFECWENLRADWVYRADLALFQMGITKPPE